MKIALTHGYFLNEDKNELKIMKPYPPLGLLYISAFLEENGYPNEVIDNTFSDFQTFCTQLEELSPEFIGIYVNLMTKINVLKIVRKIRESKKLKDIKILIGGPEVRYNRKDFIEFGVDYCITGEGEETTLELIEAVKENSLEKLQSIKGLTFYSKGELIVNNDRPLLKDINLLPIPAREKIDFNQYLQVWKQHHGYSSVSVSTMRGCPYTCKWCSRAVYGLSYRRRSPAKVVEELIQIKRTVKPDLIWFVDDVFTISHNWLEEFSKLIKSEQVDLKYECITRADRLNDKVIALLKLSGCVRVWIGAESGSQKVIDLMNRRVDVEVVRDMITKANNAGIETGTFIMLGYPGETENDIEETIAHLKKANPKYFTITLAYPIRGTELSDEIESFEIRDYDFQLNTDRDRDFIRTYKRIYYKYALIRVNNEVNSYRTKVIHGVLNIQYLRQKLKSIIAKLIMTLIRVCGGTNNVSSSSKILKEMNK